MVSKKREEEIGVINLRREISPLFYSKEPRDLSREKSF